MFALKFNLPYLGTSGNDEIFQYVLQKITPKSALISIPSWLENAASYQKTQKVNLHLDGWWKKRNAYNSITSGIATKLEETYANGSLYRVEFESPLEGWQLFQKTEFEKRTPSQMIEMILERIKDSLLLKGGIQVYLQHFIPYLSRLLILTFKDFDKIKNFILVDTQQKVQKNEKELETFYQTLFSKKESEETFYCSLDLDLLKNLCQSEIDTALFKVAFGNTDNLVASLEGKIEEYSIRTYQAYLQSIKTVEYRLYKNLNDITWIYSYYVNKVTHEWEHTL